MSKYIFDNEEEFDLILGNTISFNNMQNTVSKIVSFIDPMYLIEFGSGNGNTSLRLGKENPNCSIVAVDIRENMVELGNQKLAKHKVKNVAFVNGDLTKLNNFNIKNANAIVMMYSFKFIEDPNKNKVDFLTELYSKMQKGAYVIIGDVFLEESETKEQIKSHIENIFYNDSKDVFWSTLNGLDKNSITESVKMQNLSREKTKEQAELAAERNGVFYVDRNFITKTAKKIGFDVILSERLNNLSETIYVLQK